MTEKDLHRLSRQDLLQLLLVQSKEVARQKNTVAELKKMLEQERELTDRLKTKLDEKDEAVEQMKALLKAKLDEKDEAIAQVSDRLKAKLDEKDEALVQVTDRLKAKLDDKDQTIEHLKDRLKDKDETIIRLREGSAGARMGGAAPAAPYPADSLYRLPEERYGMPNTADVRQNGMPAAEPYSAEEVYRRLKENCTGLGTGSLTADYPASRHSAETPGSEERLRYLKDLLAESEAMADRLRKGKK